MRRIWPLLPDDRSRTAVELTEWRAEGDIDWEDLREAGNAVYRASEDASVFSNDRGEPPDKRLYGSSRPWRTRPYEDDPVARRYLAPHPGIAAFHAAYAAFMLTVLAVDRVLSDAQEAVWFGTQQGQRSAVAQEVKGQAGLVREVFGNSFRPLPPIALSLLTTNDGLIQRLSVAAYENRLLPSGQLDPQRLAVLADALEEAGADAARVAHLREPGPHVRGCAVVELLTGR